MMSYGWEGSCVEVYNLLEYRDLGLGYEHLEYSASLHH